MESLSVPAGAPPPQVSPAMSLDPDSYLVRAKTPSSLADSDSRPAPSSRPPVDEKLPVDIVPVGRRGYTSLASSAASASGVPARRNGGHSAPSAYYTDTNFPEHFWESAPSLKDMIVKH